MANRLKMATVQSMISLHARGWSQRRIVRALGVDRESVARHLRLARESAPAARSDLANPEPAMAPISSPGSAEPKPAKAPLESAGSADSKPANAPILPAGSAALEPSLGAPSEVAASGRQSDCEPWREVIQAKQATGLSARRIHQDLVAEHAAEVSYDSVRRFSRRLGWTRPLPFRRLECAPGQDVDGG